MPQDQEYTVRPNDSLAKIAETFNVQGGHQALATYNKISNPNLIRVGQKLKIPGSGGGGSQPRTYTVKSGDTLAAIAAQFNYPGGYQALAAANNIANPALISVGQTLQVGTGSEQGQGDAGAQTTGGQTSGGQTSGGQTSGGQTGGDTAGGGQSEETVKADAPISGEAAWINAAVTFNKGRSYSKAQWKQIQEKIGTTVDGSPGKMTARAVYRWQESHDLEKDGKVGSQTLGSMGISANAGGQTNEGGSTNVEGLRAKILEIAKSTLSTRTGHHYYSQPGALTDNPLAKSPLRSDCSQWVRAVYLKAGASDPGTYTGAMVDKSKKTNSPTPGDIMVKRGHVELYVGDGKTIGHGSPPINYGTTAYWAGKGMYFATYDFLNR